MRKPSFNVEEMKIYGNSRYNALVNSTETSSIDRWSNQVLSEECKDVLRQKKTAAYEVAKHEMKMIGSTVQGCIFRFADEFD